MSKSFSRTELLLGKDAMDRLSASTVAIFGIGGVGSFTAEALARGGVGTLYLIDDDVVSETNINRQLIATTKTIGKVKVELMKERILEINPEANVIPLRKFFTAENADEFDFRAWNYIVDAIDTVSSKLVLIEKAREWGIPVISCMGAGNKLDPTRFEVADIFSTSVCPLAKVMRRELKNRGISSLKVVYSREIPVEHRFEPEPETENAEIQENTMRKGNPKKQVPGSVSFVPSVAGLILAGEVIKDLIKRHNSTPVE